MNDQTYTEIGAARLYQAKCEDGLVDVKFLHKNLDEGSPAQVEADLCSIQEAISKGCGKPLDFGDYRLIKTA
ncbi:hypothetical protein [Ruegeria meonggei]|uniref:hypothetical protein n=1 Tax=Ruegeria meonggei TaxID=1446476 RepID=UPI00366C381C